MSRPHSLDDILARLPDAKHSGSGWTASCPVPGHHTPADHLSVTDGGDKALVTCHGPHDYREICGALGFQSLTYDTGSRIGGVASLSVKRDNLITTPKIPNRTALSPTLSRADNTDNAPGGLTLAALADAKRLPVDFLKALGITDFKYQGRPFVKIPYYGVDGGEIAMRHRLALSGGERFKWHKGSKPAPYGLHRLPKSGRLLVVEGESDCWTCWHHGIPALGAPGKSNWPEAWREHLAGLDVVVWCEPGAQDFVLRVLKTAPALTYITAPDGVKDISDAHLQELDVKAWLDTLPTQSGQALKARLDNENAARLYDEARHVIEAADPLAQVEQAILARGYGGDTRPPTIAYLAMTSRLLEMRTGMMPVHLLLTGASSSGKSYTLGVAESLLPPEAVHHIDAGSPRTLIYDDEPLQHRVLVFGEADSLPAGEDNPAASAVRNLLQEHRLRYDVTAKNPDTGEYTVRRIDKPGPTCLITTATRPLGEQLSTRLFTLEISDSREQISAALRTQAKLETAPAAPPDAAMVAFQAWLQLQAPCRVVVPFAEELYAALTTGQLPPRILRDFPRLLSLIKTVALLRQHRRSRDADGNILATLHDYAYVRGLVNAMFMETVSGATADMRALVEAVIELEQTKQAHETITPTKLAGHLGIGYQAANRRAKRALRAGWLVNHEARKHHPADYGRGEPMPSVEGLPDVIRLSPEDNASDNANSFVKTGTIITLSPLTDRDAAHTLPGCVKGPGGCNLRTDSTLDFSCANTPATCCFLVAGDGL